MRETRGQSRWVERSRRGTAVVVGLAGVVGSLLFVAASTESTNVTLTRANMQQTCDDAALAAARELRAAVHAAGKQVGAGNDVETRLQQATADVVRAATQAALAVARRNEVFLDAQNDVEFGKRTLRDGPKTRASFTWGGKGPYNAVKVTARRDNPDTSRPDGKLELMGGASAAVVCTAVAYLDPRDMVLVMDHSGSMNDDSTFARLGPLSRDAVLRNMEEIWKVLDDRHDLGGLSFTPQYLSQTQNSAAGPATVTFRRDTIDVVAAETLAGVVLEFNDGSAQTFGNLSSARGTFAASAANADKLIDKVTVTLRAASDERTGRTNRLVFADTVENVKTQFGLDKTRWPWPSGSWSDFVRKCRTNSHLKRAGYQRMYGGACLVHYLLTYKERYNQCPDLRLTPHYPLHACKQGFSLYLSFLQGLGFGDEVGLVAYATYALPQHELKEPHTPDTCSLGSDWISHDYRSLDLIQRNKQAGHFASTTAIGDGLLKARETLARHGRDAAQRSILLMTDGLANVSPTGFSLPNSWNWAKLTDFDGNGDADYATDDRNKQYAFYQAKLAIDAGYKIDTMSVGSRADRDLMQAIAFAGGGEWFDVPGGSTIQETERQMLAAFARIAANVPEPRLAATGKDE